MKNQQNGIRSKPLNLQILDSLLIAAAIGSGLIGGVFYAFSSLIMPAFRKVPADHAISVMRSINVRVMKSSFLAVFIGTGLLCLVTGIQSVFLWEHTRSKLIFAAGGIYLVGSILVTGLRNVPLNHQLAVQKDNGLHDFWFSYTAAWTRWNHIRTIACVVSSGLFILSLLIPVGKTA